MCYGSNNYKESAIRQLINSDKAAGSVWTPQTNYDRPPNWNTSKAGFLNGLEADFLSAIGKTKKKTVRCRLIDTGVDETMISFSCFQEANFIQEMNIRTLTKVLHILILLIIQTTRVRILKLIKTELSIKPAPPVVVGKDPVLRQRGQRPLCVHCRSVEPQLCWPHGGGVLACNII